MSQIKEDCYWYKHKMRGQRGCGVLNRLQCNFNGTCSFYETEAEYEARQQAFDEKQNNKLRIRCGLAPIERQQNSKEFYDTKRGKVEKQ